MARKKPEPTDPVETVKHEAVVLALSAEMTCSREQMTLAMTAAETEAALVQKMIAYAEENNLVLGADAYIEWTCVLTTRGYHWPEDDPNPPSLEILRNAVAQVPPDEPVVVIEPKESL